MTRAEITKDLQAEVEIISAVIAMYPHRYDGFIKLPASWRLDGALTKQHAHYGFAEPKLFYECKDRRINFGHGPDYFISASKLHAARMMTEGTLLRSCLFVRFIDGVIASLDFARHQNKFRYGGRQDRLNGADVFVHDSEALAVFQWNDFVILRDSHSDQQVA